MPTCHAIETLIYAYAERIDLADFAGVGELFADATYGVADAKPFKGSLEVQGILERGIKLYEGSPRTKHVTTNVLIEVDEEAGEAVARSYFTVLQALVGAAPNIIVAGRYHDRFVRVDGRWRFADRIMHMDLVGDLGAHLRFVPPT